LFAEEVYQQLGALIDEIGVKAKKGRKSSLRKGARGKSDE
jgi:hypothetical protein